MRARVKALLFLLGCLVHSAAGYAGFDCGQGSAILVLASHKCPSDAHQRYLSCFRSLALRVKHCGIKAWPHPHQGRKQACGSLQLVANVTDVNHAYGSLHLHGTKHKSVPVHLEYSRPDESMHLKLITNEAGADGCVLVFDAETASDASLHPIPGEDTRSIASLLVVLVPAILLPCALVGLVVSLGSIARTRRAHWHSSGGMSDDGYTLLDAGPGTAAGGQPLAEGAVGGRAGPPHISTSSGHSSCRGAMGLGILKAMSRRARAKRMRRSCRPAYVGLPEQSVQQHRAYVSGRLQPGPFHLVAPFFKFPPVAMPPPLEAIPESVTPTASSASRCSSSQDLSMGSSEHGGLHSGSPALDLDDVALLQPESYSDVTSGISSVGAAGFALQQPSLDVLGSSPVPGWAWIAPPSGDAEQGGAAGSSS